jgi:hypothetical protein
LRTIKVKRLRHRPFVAKGSVATAGGRRSSQHPAARRIARPESIDAARSAIHHVAPVGRPEDYVARTMASIASFLESVVRSG